MDTHTEGGDKMDKVFAVEWARFEYGPRYTQYIVAKDAKDARRQMLSEESVAGVVYSVRRAKDKERLIHELA